MKKTAFKKYLIATNMGKWGRGDTMLKALENACALNGKRTGVRRGIKTMAWINLQMEDDRLTKEDIVAMSNNQHLNITGYQVGDFMEPWITCYGSPCARGILERIDMEGQD